MSTDPQKAWKAYYDALEEGFTADELMPLLKTAIAAQEEA